MNKILVQKFIKTFQDRLDDLESDAESEYEADPAELVYPNVPTVITHNHDNDEDSDSDDAQTETVTE